VSEVDIKNEKKLVEKIGLIEKMEKQMQKRIKFKQKKLKHNIRDNRTFEELLIEDLPK